MKDIEQINKDSAEILNCKGEINRLQNTIERLNANQRAFIKLEVDFAGNRRAYFSSYVTNEEALQILGFRLSAAKLKLESLENKFNSA